MKTSILFIEACVASGTYRAFNALGASVSPFMALGLDVIGRGRMVFDASESVMYLAKGDVGYGT